MLQLRLEGHVTAIPIRTFSPERDGSCWQCRYEIEWPERLSQLRGTGVDSIQSLLIAVEMIGAEINTSDYHHERRLSCDAHPNGGYGFPVPRKLRDLPIGDDVTLYGASS